VTAMETLFFRQPRFVVLALFVIIVSGLSSLLTIGRQEDPTITNLFASITTVYPGADPARVEALVTAKIETRLRTIPEIAEISSTSATSVSVVLVELANTVPAARIEQVWSRVRDALADVRRDFPPGVQEPEFNSDGGGGYAAIFAITEPEGQSLARAAREAESLADLLRAVPGTIPQTPSLPRSGLQMPRCRRAGCAVPPMTCWLASVGKSPLLIVCAAW